MIKAGSKWTNGCNIVDVKFVINTMGIDCVWYQSLSKVHVLTYDDFMVCYKPYEPIYEAKYAFIYDGELNVTPMYFTKEEAKKVGYTEDQKIKISQREREC